MGGAITVQVVLSDTRKELSEPRRERQSAEWLHGVCLRACLQVSALSLVNNGL